MARARTLTLKTQVEVTGADKLDNLGRRMQKVGGILSATVTAPLALLGGVAANAASDLNESLNAINVSFGETADEINRIGETSAESFGLSQRAFNDLAVRFSSFAGTIAGEGGDVAKVIEDLTTRGSDFASVFNLQVDDALGLFQSGLAGETEPLRRFGIDLSAAAVEAHALAKGISDGIAPLTEAEKVQARYSLLMEQTAKVQGDFANTSGEVANQQRILAAETEDAAAALGQKFLPIQQKLIEFASGLLDAWSKLSPGMQDVVVAFAGIAAAAGPVLLVFGTLLRSIGALTKVTGIQALVRQLGLLRSAFAVGIVGAVAAATVALDSFIDDALSPLTDGMRDLAKATGEDVILVEKTITGLADTIDVEFSEAERRVRSYMEATGVAFDTAVEHVEHGVVAMTDAQRQLAEESGAAWSGMYDAVRGGSELMDAAATDLADGIPEAMADAEAAGMEIAKRTPGSLAGELRAGIDDYDEALEELADTAANSVSDLAERQKIEGILASQQLTDALNSDSTRTRLLALELVEDLVADYELLGPGALGAGSLVNPALQDGIESNLGLAKDAGEAVVDAAGNPLLDTSWATQGGVNIGVAWANGLRSTADYARLMAWEVAAAADPALHGLSPPKEGPLKDIDKGGFNVGIAWANGLMSAGRLAGQNAAALAGTVASSLRPGRISTPGVSSLGAGGGGDVHIHLTVMGDLRADEQTLPETIRRAIFAGGIA